MPNKRKGLKRNYNIYTLPYFIPCFTAGSEEPLLFPHHFLPLSDLQGLISMHISSTTLGNLKMGTKAPEQAECLLVFNIVPIEKEHHFALSSGNSITNKRDLGIHVMQPILLNIQVPFSAI